MIWDGDKVKILRRRMGWSQSDLARRLHCETQQVQIWESRSTGPLTCLQNHLDALVLLEREAEMHSDMVVQSTLAEVILEETREGQIDRDSVQKRFFE
jgi:transcriptional regulator with XRE-family HTH domain